MGSGKHSSQGFTLIASLLILVLLSGIAAGLLYLVTDEAKMGGNDLEANLAYYGAESGMEDMTSAMAALYESTQSPTEANIQALANFTTLSMVPGVTYSNQITFPAAGNSSAGMPCVTTQTTAAVPPSCYNTVTSGADTGLYAELTPMTLSVIATRPSGATVSITRTVEVAELPVFQFGVFCGYDCSYFAGPNFSFGGRVHTNQNLFLASGADLVFNDKVQAFQQIITDRLENGNLTTNGYGGTTYVPSASGGCPLNTFPPTGANCIALPGGGTIPGDASWSGGYPTIAGAANANFPSLSTGTFNGYLANSLTGVTNLQLPFVQNSCVSNPPPCTDPISIVRKPQPGESPTGTLGSERLYNKASLRILIADTQADLHPDWSGTDASDVQFPNVATWNTAPFNNASNASVTLTGGTTTNVGTVESVGFATPANPTSTQGWVFPYTNSGLQNGAAWSAANAIPLIDELTSQPTSPAAMNGPWIRVEYCKTPPCNVHTNFVGVTQEWLKLGFGQPFNTPPTTPFGGAGQNPVNENAILILQQLQPGVAVSAGNIAAHNTWWPINFYDTREGEMRDNPVNNYSPTSTQAGYPSTYSSCSVNGIMNAVELDVGNLARWLNGTMGNGTTGANVSYASLNGYVVYFSDHRGMLTDPNASNGGQTPANSISGEAGIEDVINAAQNLASTTTDGVLEPKTYYGYSPEDVDQNNVLDNWGEKNLGYGFGVNTNTNPLNPFLRVPYNTTVSSTTVNCAQYNLSTSSFTLAVNNQVGLANPVSGARHVLKLVDGGMSSGGVSPLPVMPAASTCTQSAANPTGCGGVTFASENPVYVQGNFNSSSADAFWGTANATPPTQTAHSAASIIADAVTVLSNQWNDAASLVAPTTNGKNSLTNGTTTISVKYPTADGYYRMAVSGGKNIPFPQPNWNGVAQDFGTDGGMHNFLRYLEDWSGQTLHFNGSLVSMYYAEYDTGTFKCCAVVYNPPARDYYFDVLFLNPANLPPATPMFQDVVNLSYHQNFTPQ
ncbi:MAG: PilX N-terminal domain-containing pilus assembly protein [Candidatus Sulfotelmatobacter sp.]|jgi:Tfp pilus assembly protein PilX